MSNRKESQQQRQDSLYAQLWDVRALADPSAGWEEVLALSVRMGCYDAADYIERHKDNWSEFR